MFGFDDMTKKECDDIVKEVNEEIETEKKLKELDNVKITISYDCCLKCINSETCELNELSYTINELKGLCKKIKKKKRNKR